VAIETRQIIQYPIARFDDLTVPDFYADLQRQGAVEVQMPWGEPCWLTTSYADVKTVYGDKRFGKEFGVGRDTPRMTSMRIADDASMIAFMDPPRHTRVRRLALAAFSAHQVGTLRGWVDGVVDDLVDQMLARTEPVDFIELVSWNLPLTVITGILGVPVEEIPIFRGWVDVLMNFETPDVDKGEAVMKLVGYIKSLIADRRAGAGDDLLAIMVRARDDDDFLTEDELVSLALSLFLAGFETTAAQIGSTVFTLMTHRERWEEMRDDPAIRPAAVEELWRWIPSFRFGYPMIRWALEDVELGGGVVIPAGAAVLPEHQVANRDEAVFEHPTELDFHRVDPEPNLSLAWGAHRCLGAHLAHLELVVALDRLLERVPTLELAVAPEEVPWATTTFLRTPEALPLRW
jgi:cytochrome P450